MKTYQLKNGSRVSRIAYGCMNLGQLDAVEDRERLIDTALAAGINFYDHADIYGAGYCETVFGELLKRNPAWRDHMLIQSKCGIRFAGDTYGDSAPSRYDFSFEHIMRSVDGILERLQIEQLDILLLHRPDLLMEPDEVARAFDALSSSGKVKDFGVSNFDGRQIELLQRSLDQDLIVNQVEVSLLHAELIAEGARVNTGQGFAPASGTLDYCRLNNISIQAWSPVAGGRLFGPAADAPQHIHDASALVYELADRYATNASAILLAWLLRHPAGIQPVLGTTNPERLRQSTEADGIELSREDWYGLLERAQGRSVP
ncbi:MAG: aldo/keto reductase [Woeseiaceae bacterium]|nr:aldo/keto reductase [Woeseiaceae bacterium]